MPKGPGPYTRASPLAAASTEPGGQWVCSAQGPGLHAGGNTCPESVQCMGSPQGRGSPKAGSQWWAGSAPIMSSCLWLRSSGMTSLLRLVTGPSWDELSPVPLASPSTPSPGSAGWFSLGPPRYLGQQGPHGLLISWRHAQRDREACVGISRPGFPLPLLLTDP